MPKNPESRRYQSPEKRGFTRIYLHQDNKKTLEKAAKAAGFLTIEDYVMSLHKQQTSTQ
jgi:hypothetical protein